MNSIDANGPFCRYSGHVDSAQGVTNRSKSIMGNQIDKSIFFDDD